MKNLSLILVLSLFNTVAFAGPGVSSGDEPTSKPGYICEKSEIQDAFYMALFDDVYGDAPSVKLYLPTGEDSTDTAKGLCSRVKGADEFYLNCAVVDGATIYRVTLASDGSPQLYAAVQKMESKEPQVSLACQKKKAN